MSELDELEKNTEKKEKKPVRKKKKKRGHGLLVLMLLCLCVLGFSLFRLGSILLDYKAGTDEYDSLQQYVRSEIPEVDDEGEEEEEPEVLLQASFEELKAINSDIIAWIQIPDTPINYPVMHYEDNAYYLKHTFEKKANSAGSIFMETLNSPDFSDYHTILYGHNMRNDSMFGSLSEYKSPTYLASHPYIYIDLEDGQKKYEIFSCYEVEALSDSYTIGFAPDEVFEEFLEKIKGRSLYDTGVEVDKEDHVIALSTCSATGHDYRFIVHAKEVTEQSGEEGNI